MVDVLIVGRGPVGMTAALRLAALGVASTVIDRLPADVVAPGSKAVLIARHVIEITEPVGVGARIAEEGLAWTTGRVFVRGREVRATRLDAPPGLLPQVVNLSQHRVEELLLERLRAEPLVTLIPDATVLRVTDEPAVTYRDPAGEHTIRARWLLGCDGARSTVRRELGIPFEGHGHDDHFLIADLVADLPFPAERHLHFDPPFNPGRTVLIHPQPDRTWHIDWQVGPGIDAAEEQANGGLDRRLRALVGEVPYQVRWVTGYRFKQLRAARFRQGQAFLVGDAAHLTSPYGARGLNSGIADAENIAWRLGLVLRGWCGPALLDGYASEREHAAAENLRITGRTARFMCPRTPVERLRQRMILAASRLPPFRRFVDSGRFYQPPRYPGVGSLLPDARIATPDPQVTRLSQLLHNQVIILSTVDIKAPTDFPVQVLTGIHFPDGDNPVPAGHFLLIRPDGYVAGVHAVDQDPAAAIAAAFPLKEPT